MAMHTSLLGLATATPPGAFTQAAAARLAADRSGASEAQQRIVARLYEQACVEQRASVLDPPAANTTAAAPMVGFYPPAADASPTTGQRMQAYVRHAGPLAARAAEASLRTAGIEPGRVRHLVTVSCTGFHAPGLDVELIDNLALPAGVTRTHVGFMGCHGAINGLRVAVALARQHAGDHVLLCAAELCSLHMQYGYDRDHLVANALFSDGAAAVLLRAVEPPHEQSSRSWHVIDTASHLVAGTRDAMTWTIGDHGFRMTLSPRVPHLIREHLPPWLAAWLAGHGLAVGDIASWAVHPGGPRILDAVAQGLELDASRLDASRRVLARMGNMSSPTVLFILDALQQAGAGGPAVMLAFGPGLTVEAALLG
ncbi:MAG: type III polyketide synthase [Phycisphaeraceae bacterium]